MTWISTRMRITVGLVCLTLSVLLVSMLIGVLPDRDKAVLEGRRALCEALAVDCSIMASQKDMARLQTVLKLIAKRDPDILSAALRRNDGDLLVEVGDHRDAWQALDDEHSIDTQVQVPIHAGGKHWGNVEIRFRPITQAGLLGFFFGPRSRLLWFVCGSCFLLYFFYMKKMLDYLDPSQSVPGHVRSALDTLAEGLLVIDARDRIVLANGAFAAMVGKAPEQLVGHTASRLPWVHEKKNEPPAALPWVVALREKTAKTNMMLRLETVGGGLRTFIVNSSPVLGSKGQYRGVLASFDDVTDLEEKERELHKAVASADAANRTKSEFLANMSHEIRTPMNAILGFTDILRRGFAADEETRQHYLDTVHSSGKHLLELINDILDLSKIEAGRLEVERKPCAPCELISELVTMFTVPAQNRGISLEFNTAGPVPATILTDPTRLRQIIANLLGNAIKFTENGGVKIVARLMPNSEKPQLAIDVIDSGIGMSPEGLKRIFNPFVQADSTVTRRFGGTGLGLTISRRFAQALGGDVTVASELGKGSTFTAILDTGPLDGIRLLDGAQAQASLAAASKRSTKELPKLPPARILVADDGEANRQLITVILTRAGLKVENAENGEVAVRMASSQPFDLILMDMQMPVMDGYSATTRLRQQGMSIPIVALTANAMKGDVEKCRAAGCSAFVAKPVDIDELMRCLTEQLKGMAAPSLVPGPAVSPPDLKDTTGHTTGENRLPAESSSATTDGEIQQDTAEFVRFTRDNLNAMHGALQNSQFAALAELAGALARRADEAGHSGFRTLAIQVKELASREAADEIADVICDLAGLSEAIALRSLESDERPLDIAAEEAKEIEVAKPIPPPTPRTAARRRAPLLSSLPMDDPDFRQIVAGFIPRLREQAVAMQAAWEQRDLEELARLSHWLKGAGGTVGFDALTDPAKTLEQLAKKDQVDEIDVVLAELLDLIDSAVMPPAKCNGVGLKL